MRVWMASRVALAHGLGGGMERYTDTVGRGLVERGHEVTLVTTDVGPGPGAGAGGGMEVVHLPGSTWRRYRRRWWADSWDQLRRANADRPYDVVLSQSAGALGYLAAARTELGLASVVVLHGSATSELVAGWRGARTPRGVYRLARQGWRVPPLLLRWRRVAAAVDRWVAVSEGVAAQASKELGVPRDRFTVVPPGADLERFCPDPAAGPRVRRRLGIPATAPVVAVVTRLEVGKGVDVALDAVARLRSRRPDLHLVVAGAGHHRRALAHRARGLGLDDSVRFLGFVGHDRLPGVLAAADVFLMPSLLPEGFPVSVAEAMAAGIPVVASATPGGRAAVDHGRTGLLVAPGDAAAAAAAIARILADAGRGRAMGAAARAEASARLGSSTTVDGLERVLVAAGVGSGDGRPRV